MSVALHNIGITVSDMDDSGEDCVCAVTNSRGIVTVSVGDSGLTNSGEDDSLRQGLVSYWGFDDASGTNLADAHGANSGTLTGTQGWTTGKVGGGFDFNEASRFDVGNSSDLNVNTSGTISAWIYPHGPTSGEFHCIFSRATGASTGYLLILNHTTNFIQFLPNGGTPLVSTSPVTINAWNHVLAKWFGTSCEIWINGVLAGTGTISIPGSGTTVTAYIGDNAGSTQDFDGVIDELAIWNRRLSAAEIAQVYNSGSGLSYDSLGGRIELTGTITELNDFFKGETSGTITVDTDVTGDIDITISVTDSDEHTGTAEFSVSVQEISAFSVASPSNLVTDENVAVDLRPAFEITGASSNAAWGTLVLSADDGTITCTATAGTSVQHGNGTDTVSIVGIMSALATFLDTSTVAMYTPETWGENTVTATATDQYGQTSFDTATVDTEAAPVWANTSDIAVTNGVTKDLDGLIQGFTDADDAGGSYTVRLSIPAASGTLAVTAGNSGCTVNTITANRIFDIIGTRTAVNNHLAGGSTGVITYNHTVNGTYVLTQLVTDADSNTDTEETNLVVS